MRGEKLSPEDKIKMFEDNLKLEANYCARIAYIHQNAKETVAALKLKIKELKERYKKELKEKEKSVKE